VDSGSLMLFGERGERRFAGGVTIGRGHEGPSPGGDALAALLTGQGAALDTCPAFGCRLIQPQRTSSDALKSPSNDEQATSSADVHESLSQLTTKTSKAEP
jgi:hypothetical protein